jgi:hypothetical protein
MEIERVSLGASGGPPFSDNKVIGTGEGNGVFATRSGIVTNVPTSSMVLRIVRLAPEEAAVDSEVKVGGAFNNISREWAKVRRNGKRSGSSRQCNDEGREGNHNDSNGK